MKNKMRIWIGCGMACIVLLLISSWYAVAFNDARLVKPMDLGSYTFKAQDTRIAIVVTLSLALALRILLAEYLLYRYDHDGQAEESED